MEALNPNPNPAPIALFVYNRPEHTMATIIALKKNPLSYISELFIFSDAPKDSNHELGVKNVRDMIQQVTGFKSITIIERNTNFGLAKSIIDGVTQVISKFGKIIVLEDDLVTAPSFLNYMNSALDFYEKHEKIVHVSASIFPLQKPEKLPPFYFYRATSCWGWATWSRSWKLFEPDANRLIKNIVSTGRQVEFNISNRYPYLKMLSDVSENKINSWAIRWYASVFVNEGLCLHPANSYVNNIGHDGSGTHCIQTRDFDMNLNNAENTNFAFPSEFVECKDAVRQIMDFFESQKGNIWARFLRKLKVKVDY